MKRNVEIATEMSQRLIEYAESDKNKPIRKYKPPKRDKSRSADEETMVALYSDSQIAHLTPTYNFETYKARNKRYVEKILRIADLDRKGRPINHIELFLQGDIVHGERVGKTVDLDELEDTVAVAMFDVALPGLEYVISNLAQNFNTVGVRCVWGNHGVVSRDNALTTNWDYMIYKILEREYRNNPHVEFSVPSQFYHIQDVMGWKFFLTHGDKINMWMNIPVYGIIQKIMRWAGSIGSFDYATFGHFHNHCDMDWNDKRFFINGNFTTDDQWAIKVLGLKGSCSQMLLNVHRDLGVVNQRKMHLEPFERRTKGGK